MAKKQLDTVRYISNSYNIPHDAKDSTPMTNFIYLGIEYDLTLQACRIPSLKVHKLLNILSRFVFGPMSSTFTKKEVESLQGKLIYFSHVNLFIRPLITVFIHLNKRTPAILKFKSSPTFSFKSIKTLLPDLRFSAKVLYPLIKTNPQANFDWLFPPSLNHKGCIFTDAAGVGDGFGIGVVIENITAFQCPRSLYKNFLLTHFHATKNLLHIMY